MEVELLAFDSMGVRSMCTRIKTVDLDLVIDPSAALGPLRYGLPPHRLELERLDELSKVIIKRALKASLLIITHYHYDHYDAGEQIPLDIFSGKTVLIKDPKNNISSRQGDFCAPLFMGMVREVAKRVEVSDGKKFTFGGTSIEFSKALVHGASSLMGFVTEVMVEEGGDKVMHTSDVQGFVKGDQAEFVTKNQPRLVIADGPVTYMLDHGYSQESLDSSMTNIKMVLGSGVKELILDHHFLRDLNYRRYLHDIFEEFPSSKIMTAAEFMGKENDLLEARRKELYSNE